MKKIIGTFETYFTGYFNASDLRKCINKHFLGQENCNVYDEKSKSYITIKHPKMEQVKNVQQSLLPNKTLKILADLDEDGNLLNFRIK